jgi:hypothetical protein
MAVTIVPCFLGEARAFVGSFHRHNKPPLGGVFAVGASDGDRLVGVAIVGRPVARLLQDGTTLEVTRCCVLDDAPKGAPSSLYGAAWRAAKALGWRRLITYTLQTESGASLRGAGWRVIAERAGNDPASWQTRPGRAWQSVTGQAKFVWEARP